VHACMCVCTMLYICVSARYVQKCYWFMWKYFHCQHRNWSHLLLSFMLQWP